MTTQVNDGGVWKSSAPYANDNGVWKAAQEVWVNDGGTWKLAFQATSFSPDSGSYNASGADYAEYVITCSVAATWTWTRTAGSNSSASVASGGSATSITFSCTSFPGPGGLDSTTQPNSVTFTVTGTANGITKTYTIELDCFGGSPG